MPPRTRLEERTGKLQQRSHKVCFQAAALAVTIARPDNLESLRDAVADALAADEPLEIVAGGSERALGRPLQLPRTLDLSGLSGIRDYEASELVLTAAAGTPMAEIEAALDRSRQILAFEPPDWSALLSDGGIASGGQSQGGQTLGGVLACNLAGPRRIKAGSARDHFLGFRAVSGRGEIFKAGGKVVKNVTGYDLPKLMAGSWGTLAALEEVTVKVLPRPEHGATILLAGLDPARATRRMSEAMGCAHEISAAAYLPPERARGMPALTGLNGGIVALRIEGPVPSVAFRRERVLAELALEGESGVIEGGPSKAFWAALRDAAPLVGLSERRVIWRVSVEPSRGASLALAVAQQLDAIWYLDWAGGLLWLAVADAPSANGEAGDGGAACIRRAIRGDGSGTGHATVIKAPPALRRAIPVFEPQPAALAALSLRVKEGFDPKRLLNRGRMLAGRLTAIEKSGNAKAKPPVQTNFSDAQLADPDTAESEKILRKCVHCGFCTATCPTYVLLGDELDSPRGRIYLIKEMLEGGKPPTADTVKHIDRCLSCLSCMTTCPSGVNYMHLVDHGRKHIEAHYRRSWLDRAMRQVLGVVLTRPWLLRLALAAALPAKLLPASLLPQPLRAMTGLAPPQVPTPSVTDTPQVFPAEGTRRLRVALLVGCAEVLAPEINEATVRLLTRHGCEVVVARGSGCCGSLRHHLGQEAPALASARANIDAWEAERVRAGLDAIVINASGCGTTVKDYGFMLREEPAYADKAARIAALAKDVTEVMTELGIAAPAHPTGQRDAYHSACSMQHGQRLRTEPKALLAAAGFAVVDVPEGHLCCGSAGTYNILQPAIASRLRDRKLANIALTHPDLVATGNIGCITQLGAGADVPVVHTVELLDWATGGPKPAALAAI